MPTEDCGICGTPVSLAEATHLLVNPSDAEGVADAYLCRRCYEGELAPLLNPEEEATEAPEGA